MIGSRPCDRHEPSRDGILHQTEEVLVWNTVGAEEAEWFEPTVRYWWKFMLVGDQDVRHQPGLAADALEPAPRISTNRRGYWRPIALTLGRLWNPSRSLEGVLLKGLATGHFYLHACRSAVAVQDKRTFLDYSPLCQCLNVTKETLWPGIMQRRLHDDRTVVIAYTPEKFADSPRLEASPRVKLQ